MKSVVPSDPRIPSGTPIFVGTRVPFRSLVGPLRAVAVAVVALVVTILH